MLCTTVNTKMTRECVWCYQPVTAWYDGETRKHINSDQVFGVWSPFLCSFKCARQWDDLYDSLRYVHDDGLQGWALLEE